MPSWKRIVKAVIPAAGFGTRMLPATKAIPKEMLPVAGKPLIQYAVEEAAASGIETVILVVRDRKSLIRDHFGPARHFESFLNERGLHASATLVRNLSRIAELRFVVQKKPLGLAHAVSCARPLLGDEAFAVLLPDVIMVNGNPVTRQLIGAYQQTKGSLIAVREVQPREVGGFGVVQVGTATKVQSSRWIRIAGLVEKPQPHRAPSRLGVFGRYLLEPSIWSAIARTRPDAKGEVQLTDALNLLCQDEALFGLCFEGQHYDAGNPLGYLRANLEIALQDPRLREPLLHYASGLRAELKVSRKFSSSKPVRDLRKNNNSPRDYMLISAASRRSTS